MLENRLSPGMERKSHFEECDCDNVNERRACVTEGTAGLDVRKSIKGSQRKNECSNTASLPTHSLRAGKHKKLASNTQATPTPDLQPSPV